jgi:hypothetical protein
MAIFSGCDPVKIAAISSVSFFITSGPIVGLQIRRTDKITFQEAEFHNTTEYMVWAEKWFTVQSIKQRKQLERKIFISTDDPDAIREIRQK